MKGSRVTVMEKCSDGWWRGSFNGQIGWFPSNYVLEEADEAAAEAPSFLSLRRGAAMSNGQGARVLHVVQTLYPFSSVTEEELSFEKGETMEVIEKPENDPEWWKCKNARGQVGLVPKNYVVVLSDGPALHPTHTPQISYTGPSASGRFAGREWYYGNVTRHQAECVLNERGVEGDFLIRDSESSVSAQLPFWGRTARRKLSIQLSHLRASSGTHGPGLRMLSGLTVFLTIHLPVSTWLNILPSLTSRLDLVMGIRKKLIYRVLFYHGFR